MRPILFLLVLLTLSTAMAPASAADPAPQPTTRPIRVVVWDEQQPEQLKAYPDFIGNVIAAHLKTVPGLSVRSVSVKDKDLGLSNEVLDNCDVLVWWSHFGSRKIVTEAHGKAVVKRIKAGQLSLISLHSAHWSAPFIEAMNERSIEDALNSLPEADRASAEIKLIPSDLFKVPKRTDPITPAVAKAVVDGKTQLELTLPRCVFPAYRGDGKPSHVTTLLPDHPIAIGLPKTWDIPQTEMYDEPFHVPTPDAVIFEEKWDKGEHFRSGCVWSVGKGRVFYFRPGHETFPVYKQPETLKVIENACKWLGGA
jgi:trehalose utilization protein